MVYAIFMIAGLVAGGCVAWLVATTRAVGSLELRILPSARRFKDLGAAHGEDIPVVQPLQAIPRPLALPETGEGAYDS